MKRSFSTGEIAKLCQVASRTVCKWVDSGALRGYRMPITLDRRVHREELIRFLVAHGFPLPASLAGPVDQAPGTP